MLGMARRYRIAPASYLRGHSLLAQSVLEPLLPQDQLYNVRTRFKHPYVQASVRDPRMLMMCKS